MSISEQKIGFIVSNIEAIVLVPVVGKNTENKDACDKGVCDELLLLKTYNRFRVFTTEKSVSNKL